MDFDFNWILVPVTFIFLLIWLLDKFSFKQQAQFKAKQQQVMLADQAVTSQQIAFEHVKNRYPHLQLTEHIVTPNEPSDVTQARDQLNQLKLTALRAHQDLSQFKKSPVIEWAYDFLPILAIVLVVRSFLVEPFNIPSESMNPTLETGDFVLVNKFAFGVRLPLINTKIIDSGEPQHGDVAVFRFPKNPSISFIKRVIGVPGDHIEFMNGELTVNGQKLPYQLGKNVQLPVGFKNEAGQPQTLPVQAVQWQVKYGQHQFISQYITPTQTNPVAVQLLQAMQHTAPLSLQQNWQIDVPKGHYFMMGDNRDQSDDSRYWGFVPEENLTGKAVYLWMHKQPGLHVPTFARNGRIP